MKDETKIVVTGRDPKAHAGAVNTPVYHASTIIYPSLAAIRGTEKIPYTYGRRGTPTTAALQNAMNALEGADGTMLTASGASAVSLAILSAVEAGRHLLMVDSVYQPTRKLCDQLLAGLGVETEYYDPLIGGDIAALIRDNTAMIFMESPGSQTFEIQDVPAIVAAAQKAGVKTAIDNTWATPLHFRPLDHGVDFSVLAATKYVVGHADALLGTVAAKGENFTKLQSVHGLIGHSVGPDDVFLALRGLRTMPTRMKQHQTAALQIAEWLQGLSFVRKVLYPALPGAPGHALWQRDFSGAGGLFTVELDPCSEAQLAAMLDNMRLFAMGYSWGGFESLIVPCKIARTVTPYETDGQMLRLNIGLEHIDDLKDDLRDGFARAGYKI
ncbi:MAG: cystathionine beta-lyase [PS1 clade bacterium]|uniref:Cystathionine beta-lyase n=1 Tax=PS1 clade bacterium TaxID=2175152 RepID=A0A937HP60_9PROT|nr:cystathionine beta-lyase [PS1 clade bacterium]